MPKKKTEDKPVKKQVAWEDFIKAWESSESIAEVAEKTGQSPITCQVRASELRKMGLPIKRFAGKRQKLTPDEAREMLAKAKGVPVSQIKMDKEKEKNPLSKLKMIRA